VQRQVSKRKSEDKHCELLLCTCGDLIASANTFPGWKHEDEHCQLLPYTCGEPRQLLLMLGQTQSRYLKAGWQGMQSAATAVMGEYAIFEVVAYTRTGPEE